MNEAMRSDRSDVPDVEHLIVPISAFFGPVYRPLNEAGPLRKDWSSTVNRGLLAVIAPLGILALIAGLWWGGADGTKAVWVMVALFWSALFLLQVSRWLIGFGWVRRNRAGLERVQQVVTLDARLAANEGLAGLDTVRRDVWGNGVFALMILIGSLMQEYPYPWIFGPLALLFAGRSWTAFRVLRFRSKRANAIPSDAQCSENGASS